MGLATNQARLNVLTIRKADLEYRLTSMMFKQEKLAIENGELVAQKSQALETYVNDKNNGKDVAPSFLESAAYIDYENAMAELEAAQTRLDQEQETIETQHQQVQAEEEQIQKLVDSNIKASFKYFN